MYLYSKLQKVSVHFERLEEYYNFIKDMDFDFTVDNFNMLSVPQKAVLEAYLKRFAALQDYLGNKVFKSLLESAGIGADKMSEILTLVEKEGIIDLEKWIEFRNLRNNLEHDYPDELEEALDDLYYCIESFEEMKSIVQKVFEFAGKYNENIKLP